MGSNTKPEASQEAIDNAKLLWGRFTVSLKYGVIFTVACLALMAFALV